MIVILIIVGLFLAFTSGTLFGMYIFEKYCLKKIR